MARPVLEWLHVIFILFVAAGSSRRSSTPCSNRSMFGPWSRRASVEPVAEIAASSAQRSMVRDMVHVCLYKAPKGCSMMHFKAYIAKTHPGKTPRLAQATAE
eukprot:4651512-Pyramimonas_sp.AAC.1